MATLKAVTYPDLAALLPNDGDRKTIGNNTVAQRDGHAVNIYLHASLIVTLTEFSVDYTLAGWPTVTTRERLSQFLRPFGRGVGQRNGRQVLVRLSDGKTYPLDERATYTLTVPAGHDFTVVGVA
jgi:hypothetical protein